MNHGSIEQLKRLAVEKLLELEDFFLIVVDTRVRGVVLPDELLAAQKPVGVHIGHRMRIPVPDMIVDDNGIRGTLSFARVPFLCVFPWGAIRQISVGDEHLVWLETTPRDPATTDAGGSTSNERPKLRVVK